MKLGALTLNSKLYNLDSMQIAEISEILDKNKKEKNDEINKAKNICNREIDKENSEILNIPEAFKSFVDKNTIYVKAEALLYRAIVEKATTENIREKVNNKRNAIYASIKKITPKYSSTNSKFHNVQEDIQNSIMKYENVLTNLAEFYDKKIEQLIIRKVELEAHLVGKIIKEEYLIEEENKKKEAKENDKLLNSLSNSIKNAITKLTKKKSENQIDVTMISKLHDKEEVEEEQIQKFKKSLENTISKKQENTDSISSIEKEILSIEKEINRLNENKKSTLINAMESYEKQLIIANEKKSIVSKIKLFFKAKFNASKVIYETIIEPFNQNIDEFVENEMESIKGN